jgi:hypothetical protein
VEKAPSLLRFAGAIQNALVETQRPINLSKGLLNPLRICFLKEEGNEGTAQRRTE